MRARDAEGAAEPMPDETCRAFDSVAPADPDLLHRFVVGADPATRKLTRAEAKALGDPFAVLLLARGRFPRSGEELVDGIRAAVPKGHALRQRSTFVVGEGSKLPSTPKTVGRRTQPALHRHAGPRAPGAGHLRERRRPAGLERDP